jgi:hypothetical protein
MGLMATGNRFGSGIMELRNSVYNQFLVPCSGCQQKSLPLFLALHSLVVFQSDYWQCNEEQSQVAACHR